MALNDTAGKRNRYYKTKQMTAADFRLEQAYGIERRRLLSRHIAGWGVVHGYDLERTLNNELICGAGLALDEHGRELWRGQAGAIASAHVVLLDADGKLATAAQLRDQGQDRNYLLQARYAERPADQVRASDACDCAREEWNHLCETVVFTLRLLPDGAPIGSAEPPCAACAMECGPGGSHRHACLCAWSARAVAHAADDSVCHDGIMLRQSVPLAVVSVHFDRCDRPIFTALVDACTPRRIVKTNDLLFDLIRGCDLTTISELSWSGWQDEKIDWEDFAAFFPERSHDGDQNDPQVRDRPVATGFEVFFSHPVQTSTLRAAGVSFRVLVREDDSGWLEVRHVPVARLIAKADDNGTTATSAVIYVRAGWCDDEIRSWNSVFRKKTRIEIEIRGDLILDCRGQTVDANAIGRGVLPSGNGTPGGTYLSTFSVQAKQ